MPAHPDYQALFEALPGIHLALSPALTIVAASAQAAEVAGQPLEQLLGQAAAVVFAPSAASELGLIGAELQTGLAAVTASRAPHERQAGGWQHRTWPVLGPENEIRYFLYRAEPAAERSVPLTDKPAVTPDFRELYDVLPVIVWTTQLDGGADYHNARWLEYTGLTIAQAEADGWLDVVHSDDQVRVLETWLRARTGGTDYFNEYRIRRADGQYRWQLVRGVPRRDAAGAILGWTGTTLDIHDQKLVEQRLASQDRHLQQILSQVPAHIATLLGPDHVYGFLNEKGNQLFGGKVKPGMPAALAVPELVTNGYIKLVDEIYRTGKPFVLSEMPMVQPPAADGSVATLYFDGVLQPLTDEQGQTQGILVFGIDVTERVEAKQRTAELMAEIREQNAQFRTMVESLPLFVYIADEQGKILYINPQRYEFTGQQAEQGLSNWAEPLHPDDRRRLKEDFARGRRLGQAWSGEYRLRRHDGLYRWHLLRAVPMLRPEDGSVGRWYASSVDIDDQKQFQRQLETKDEYLRQILTQAPAMIATLEGPSTATLFSTAATSNW
ncbi:PAS domain S-box protein [Hymenobacter cellulosilyticus]|uniref:histidine kinase n=1 Tax=Hymenobacter cellulosilyticus TaxID=2932248 RepID=A0A8T9Q3T5_9BACT|nr:PAS domain S-box protein [Hymenobacter cellulosilyticus]UOQ71101.1 PAS domain S-box protein [Hymenobacter cellulosilyticus]